MGILFHVIVQPHFNMCNMHVTLSERRLRWLGHVRRMEAGGIPKDFLYGELEQQDAPSYASKTSAR
jgi:hypothetical protein